jgi:hypothetical protein
LRDIFSRRKNPIPKKESGDPRLENTFFMMGFAFRSKGSAPSWRAIVISNRGNPVDAQEIAFS